MDIGKDAADDRRIRELSGDIHNMMAVGAVRLDDLRSLAGRATCVSSLVHVWRPFVAMLWAPPYCQRSPCHFGPMTVWRKSVGIPLKWMDAFLRGTFGTLHRCYRLAGYLHEGDR